MKISFLRKLLVVVGVLVVVLGGLLTWLASSFDAQRTKTLAIEWMKQHHERTLVIDGPIKLSVFPRLQLQLSDVRLSEHGNENEFLALEEASLSVELLPLLSKSVVVDRISARGLRLKYTRDSKGVSNIDDLLGSEAESDAETSGSAELRLDVSKVTLQDLRANVRDDLAGVRGEVVLASLSTGRLGGETESPIEIEAQFALQKPAVRGELSGETQLMLDLPGRNVRLRDMGLNFKGDAMGVDAIDATLRGALAWNGAAKTVQAEDFSLKVAAKSNQFELVDARLEVQRFGLNPEPRNLSVAKLKLSLNGSNAGHPFMLEFAWPELEIKGETLRASAFKGKLVLKGQTSISGNFKSAAPRGNFERITLPGFEVSFEGESGPRKLSGSFKSDLHLRPTAKSVAFEKMALAAQLKEPDLQPMSVAMSGSAAVSAQQAQWALNGQLSGSDFNSSGKLGFGGSTPNAQVRARFGTLDLNALLPPPEAAPAPTSRSVSADTPVDLASLRKLNGHFDLRAGSFAYRNYRVNDAALEASLDAGVLRVSTLKGKTWGGSVDASAFADARTNRVSAKGTGNGLNLNAMLQDIAGKDILEGSGRVTFDLESSGRSVNELKSGLKGSAALQLRDGAIKGVNLAKKLRQGKAALAGKQDATVQADQAEKTDFSEMSASFAIKDGVAHNKDLDAKSPFLRVGGDGAIDIGKSSIDYTVRATVVSAPSGQDASDLASLKGLTVPVRLSGALEAMQWNIQWSSVAAGVARNQFQRELEERLGLPGADEAASTPSAKDKLKESLLRGLFK